MRHAVEENQIKKLNRIHRQSVTQKTFLNRSVNTTKVILLFAYRVID